MAEPPRVLVVDDDPELLSLVEAVLSASVVVYTAATASDALNLVDQVEFDVALVDQGLPDLSGVELIRLLRSEPATALLPLLLFTGQDASELEDDALSAGADECASKPLEPDLLEERVLALAKRSKRVAAAG